MFKSTSSDGGPVVSVLTSTACGTIVACLSLLLSLPTGCGGGASAGLANASLTSIVISPANSNVPRGSSKQFNAMGRFSDGRTTDITSSCAWTSSNPVAVIVSSSGLARALNDAPLGPVNISCNQNGISATTPATATVVAAVLSSIAVTPANQSIQEGQNIVLTASGTFTDGTTQDLTLAANWMSSNTNIVSLSVTAMGEAATASSSMTGVVTITATDPSTRIQGTTNLTVIALTSITVTGASSSVSVGSTDQLTAVGAFNDGSQLDISRSVTWALGCTPAGAATIDNTGLAAGQAVGTCNVTATERAITSPAFVLTVTLPQLCAIAGATPYLGAQAGGDRFDACISHANNTFSLLDLSGKASSVQGTFMPSATYAHLLTLNSTAPTVATGTAVEMPSTTLLIDPGTLKTRTNSPLTEPIALVFQQQPGVCPSAGDILRFVTLPQATWTTSNAAYGTVTLGSSTVTVDALALNGTMIGETDPYSCNPTTSLLTFTDGSGITRHLMFSPTGLFVGDGPNGPAGFPNATANVVIAAGDTFLGVISEPNPSPGITRTVGFNATSSASLSGFDPLTPNTSNGMVISLGAQSSPGLFTGGSLMEGVDTDSNFEAITIVVGGKKVLYGITFDTTKNTPVSVLLQQQ